jgi:tetratricopeptide (TPR) repeat protein
VSSDSGKASPTKDETASSVGSTAILHHARAFTNGLEWQIAESMLETTLLLASVYLRRGSVREAEYFIREAEQLASSINAPALLCRALAMKAEVQLQLRQLDTALTTLHAATNVLNDITGPDAAKLRMLHGEHSELLLQDKDAQQQYAEALKMLEELDKMFLGLEAHSRYRIPYLCKTKLTPFQTVKHFSIEPSPLKGQLGATSSRSFLRCPAATQSVFRASYYRGNSVLIFMLVWLLRNDIGDEYESLLRKLSQLVPLADIQVRLFLMRPHDLG